MKVQQFVQGSKVAQSQPAVASRSVAKLGTAPEAKPSDFAEALEDARKKPDSKPAESDAPTAKTPSATVAKKAKSTKDQPQRASDEQPESADVASTDDASAPPSAPTAVQDDAAGDPDISGDLKDAETSDKSDLPKVKADLSAIAQAPITGPQQPTPTEQTAPKGESDASSSSRPIPICPMLRSPMPRPAANVASNQEANADAAGDLVKTVLDGMDEVVDEAAATDEGETSSRDTAPIAKAPSAPTKQTAAGFLDDAPAPTDTASSTPQPTSAQQLPEISSDGVVDDDVMDAPEDMGPASVATAVKDPSVALSMTHVQLDPAKPQTAPAATNAPAPAPPMPPQAQFVEQNHPKIVTAMRADLLPHGGTMQIRLDPPELGALQVLVHMQDGVMTASFHTSNDDATKLLSHSLSQLKQVLESQGVSVEKLQVQQSPRDQHAGNDDQRNQPRDQQDDAYRQEQQRKEMLRRMWRKLSIGSDPLDLVA